jgi:ATP-dependent Clp protease adaptor protein ClpS
LAVRLQKISGEFPLIMGEKSRQPSAPEPGGLVLTKPKVAVRPPSMYCVILHNDDYTPMDFVVMILGRFFGKTPDEATQIMLTVHEKGKAACGIYTAEIAEIKMTQVLECARESEYPLQCTMEKA